jgi:N-acyl-phosphatidylethanolamine-hydrolysing phospholipase D
MATAPSVPGDIAEQLPVRKPTWGLEPDKQGDDHDISQKNQIKATWLGHACFLVELPERLGLSRGPRILFDPVFSDRCSPVPFMGPKRFTRNYHFNFLPFTMV